MNVHDIHARQNAAVVAALRAAGSTVEPPDAVDPTAMAATAVRNVRRRRRIAVAATVGVAALAITGAGLGVSGVVQADQQPPLPGTDQSVTRSAPASEGPKASSSPSSSGSTEAPTEYLQTGGGTLPVLAGVERGVVEGAGHNSYILGGLWYEVPPGGWNAVGDVNAGGVAGWLPPDDPAAYSLDMDESIDDMDATIELRNVFDVADWTAPGRNSGATTLDVDGADLVVIEQHERDGEVRPATVRIRSGEEGWVIETRFTADAEGDAMLRDFVGNLWLEEAGEPDWYQPEFEHPVLEAFEQGVPAGWRESEHNGLTFAVPQGWSSEPVEDEVSPGVEWTGPKVIATTPGIDAETLEMWVDATEEEKARAAEEQETFEQVYIDGGVPGADGASQGLTAPQSQLIDVPGADYAEVQPTLRNVGGEGDYYTVDIYLRQEGQGQSLFLGVELEGDEQGWEDLHTFLGTLDFRR